MTVVSTAGPVRRDLSAWVSREFGIRLTTTSSDVGLRIDDLVGLALRRNPRRAHLLVSTVLGKHLPVDPLLVVTTGRLLGELVARTLAGSPIGPDERWISLVAHAVHEDSPGPLLEALVATATRCPPTAGVVLGFAETATSLGHLVADQLQALYYLHSTRRAVPGVAVAGTFEEGHSHATRHLLLPVPADAIDAPGPLILVDDELSTGRTAMGTIIEAHRRLPRSHYLIASLIDLRSSSDEIEMALLAESLDCRIDVVTLARGRVELPDGLADTVVAALAHLDRGAVRNAAHFGEIGGVPPTCSVVPATADVERVDLSWPATVPDGGRHGFQHGDRVAFDAAVQVAGDEIHARVIQSLGRCHRERVAKVVVVGTEEFMYLPLRLAQHLQGTGVGTARSAADRIRLQVAFQSTTRSPVFPVDEPDYPIRRQFLFADPEGDLATPRFLYNAAFPPAVQPDLLVLVVDPAADTAMLSGHDGPLATLRRSGLPVLLAVVGSGRVRVAPGLATAP